MGFSVIREYGSTLYVGLARAVSPTNRGGNFHLKVGGAKSSGNAGDPMLGVAVSGGYNHPNHKVGGGQK